jgi:beta-1,4-mannosyltransferase
MFGCGLPVCAVAYKCIRELVSDGDNGLLFADAHELAAHLVELFEGFPSKESALLAKLHRTVAAANMLSWEASWERVVLPIVRAAV